MTDRIVTPTRDSFGLKSKKIGEEPIGHGIDINLFKPAENKAKSNFFRIISVGRISPIKDYKTLIEAIDILRHKEEGLKLNIKVDIIGSPGVSSQQSHFEEIKKKWLKKED